MSNSNANKILTSLVYGAIIGSSVGLLGMLMQKRKGETTTTQGKGQPRGKRRSKGRRRVHRKARTTVTTNRRSDPERHSIVGPLVRKMEPFRIFVDDEYLSLKTNLEKVLQCEQRLLQEPVSNKHLFALEAAVNQTEQTLRYFRIKLEEATRHSHQHVGAFDAIAMGCREFLKKVYANAVLDQRNAML